MPSYYLCSYHIKAAKNQIRLINARVHEADASIEFYFEAFSTPFSEQDGLFIICPSVQEFAIVKIIEMKL